MKLETILEELDSKPDWLPTKDNNSNKYIKKLLEKIYDSIKSRNKGDGEADFVKLSNIVLALNSLISALHLIKHGYFNQSYALIRIAFECKQIIELIHAKPELAKIWATGTDEKIYNNFKPSQIRRITDNDDEKKLYEYLSVIGIHPRFSGTKGHVSLIKNKSKKIVRLSVGPHILRSYDNIDNIDNLTLNQFHLSSTLLMIVAIKLVLIIDKTFKTKYKNDIKDDILEYKKEFIQNKYPSKHKICNDEYNKIIQKIKD